jgi:hypothetical protein
MNEEDILWIDNAEREELRKLHHERLKIQSVERLQNRKLEWKLLQFKSSQHSHIKKDPDFS